MTAKNGPPPDWLAPYEWAVVRLATCVAARDAPPRLVFGSVSLLEPGRPTQPDGPVERVVFGPPPRGKVFFRRVCLRAADAVEWYRAAGPGALRTPIPADRGGRLDGVDGTLVACDPLEDQPAWPTLGLGGASDAHGDAEHPSTPFRWDQRVHRRFGQDENFAGLLGDEVAVRFLARRLHIDLSRFPEHLGGLALIAPDPVLHRVEHFRTAPGDGRLSEGVVLRFVPRRPDGLAGVAAILTEDRLGLIVRAEAVAVPEHGVLARTVWGTAGATGYVAAHPVYGSLRHEPNLPFVRGVHVHTEVAAARFEVVAPLSDAANDRPERSQVTQFESWGARPPPVADGAFSRILRADGRRRRAALARQLDQIWLDGRAAAVEFLRQRVREARARVWIADPYLGGLQLLQVAHHAMRVEVTIRLLTSAEAFVRTMEQSGLAQGHRAARVERFRAGLEGLRQRGFGDVAAFVLPRRPILHDRFLVVDDRAWTIGNSLNSVGQRLSLALGIPDPDAIVERLAALTRGAEPFDIFVTRKAPDGVVAAARARPH